MPDANGAAPRRRDGVGRLLAVAGLVSLVCSLVVAGAAVLLEPRQADNALRYRQRNILEVAGLLDPAGDLATQFAAVEARVVDLETGQFTDALPPGFDYLAAARDPEHGIEIPPSLDIANIGRRARYATVYLVRNGRDLETIILPIYGAGLWAQIHGYIALGSDTNTIEGITFHQHGETPGLGGEISGENWRDKWQGKLVYDASNEPVIEVIRGKVQVNADYSGATSLRASYRVDGISGATLTGNAVTDIVRYWLGDHGYRPLLQRIWQRGGKV